MITTIFIICWLILSIFPGVLISLMVLGGPGVPKNVIVNTLSHIICSLIIGFISELIVICILICIPFIFIQNILKRNSNPLKYMGYQIMRDFETGNYYAYNIKTGNEIGKDLCIVNYNDIITKIEKTHIK